MHKLHQHRFEVACVQTSPLSQEKSGEESTQARFEVMEIALLRIFMVFPGFPPFRWSQLICQRGSS